MNEFQEAINKLAGEDLYAKIEELRDTIKNNNVGRDEVVKVRNHLQDEVSELKGRKVVDDEHLRQAIANIAKMRNYKAAYALLVKAIDKKCVIRPAKNYKRDVDAAYVEAKKVLGKT